MRCKIYFLVLVSTFCLACPPVAQAIPQEPLKGAGRDAVRPDPLGTVPPANNTPLIQPSSLSGAEDKSYVTFSSLDINHNFALARPNKGDLLERNKFELPLTLYSGSARLITNRDATSFAPEFIYMDVLSGIEWSIQDLTVFEAGRTVNGPGVSLRFDLSRARTKWVRSYNIYRKSLDPSPEEAALPTAPPPKGQIRLHPDRSLPYFNTFLDDFLASARKPRLSAFFTHQWLDGTRLATGGLSLSQVFPTHFYKDESNIKHVWGVVPRIAFQALGEDLTRFQATTYILPRYSRSVRTSLGLALQDNIPHRYYDAQTGDLDIARWRFQVGLEYVYRNVVDGDESYGLYARLRSLKDHNEVSVSISRTPLKEVQIGVGFSITTGFEPRPSKVKH